MKRTSAAVIALLFASTKAVKIQKVEGYESVSDEAERVHVLDIGANTMSNSPKSHPVMAFPSIRTAFYAQTGDDLAYDFDEKNGLWRTSLIQQEQQANSTDDPVPAIRPPPEGMIGTRVWELGMDATDGIPNDRTKSKKPSLAARKKKVSPINPDGYDPWVYKFSKENMPPYPQWQTMDNGPPPPKTQSFAHAEEDESDPNSEDDGFDGEPSDE